MSKWIFPDLNCCLYRYSFQSGLFYLWLWTLMIVGPVKIFSLSIHQIKTFCIPRFVNGDMWSCFLLVYKHSICALCCATMTHVHRKCLFSTSHWSGLKTNLLSFLICHVTLCLSLLLYLSLTHTIQHIYCESVHIHVSCALWWWDRAGSDEKCHCLYCLWTGPGHMERCWEGRGRCFWINLNRLTCRHIYFNIWNI